MLHCRADVTWIEGVQSCVDDRGGVRAIAAGLIAGGAAVAQPPKPGVKGYEVEWVYRVKYGSSTSGGIVRKYQIPILDRAKAKGYILDYRVYHPQLHIDEAARWDYRIEITYPIGSQLAREEIARGIPIAPRASARNSGAGNSRRITGICRSSRSIPRRGVTRRGYADGQIATRARGRDTRLSAATSRVRSRAVRRAVLRA